MRDCSEHRRRLGLLRRAVTERDVAQLVRHDPGDFPFGVRLLDHAAIDEHRSAGKGEGVDLFHVDAGEGVAEFRMPELRRNVLGETYRMEMANRLADRHRAHV